MTILIDSTKNETELYSLMSLPSILIVIDAWSQSTNTPHAQSVIKNISEFVTDDNFALQAVALASYTGLDNDIVTIEEPWHTNAKKIFYDSTRWQVLRNTWNKTKFVTPPKEFTNKDILSLAKHTDREYFTLWDHNQLLYYLNYVNPCVKNIIISGFRWGCCLSFRSLGHTSLSALLYYNLIDKKCNILSHKSLVSTPEEEPFDVYAPWKDIGQGWLKIDMYTYSTEIERQQP